MEIANFRKHNFLNSFYQITNSFPHETKKNKIQKTKFNETKTPKKFPYFVYSIQYSLGSPSR